MQLDPGYGSQIVEGSVKYLPHHPGRKARAAVPVTLVADTCGSRSADREMPVALA